MFFLALAEGRTEQSLHYAQQLKADGDRGNRLRTQIKGQILSTLALAGLGQIAAARAAMHESVLLAYPQGFVAPFAEEGERLLPHLQALIEDTTCDTLARRHVKSIQQVIARGINNAGTGSLNERERQIVSYLAEGASNKLIGRRLGITENTVKFHLKKVFFKLDVSSRRAAVAKISARGSLMSVRARET